MQSVTMSALAAFPGQLEQYFLAIPDSHWSWKPDSWEGIPSESFTALEQLCHIRDVEIDGYHNRFRRLLNEVEPTLDSLDGYTLARERRYADADWAAVLKEFSSARHDTLEILDGLTPDQFVRRGYFEGYGWLTLQGLVHYLCSHDQQHLSGLQWLLGKIESVRLE